MVILFNLSLILAFLLGGFAVWRLSRGRGLAEDKVLDLVIFGTIIGVMGGRLGAIRQIGEIGARGVMGKVVAGGWGEFWLEGAVIAFLLFCWVILRWPYKWNTFPLLDFLAEGAAVAQVVVVLGLIMGGIGETGGLGGRGVQFLFSLNMLILVEMVRRYHYQPGRLLEIFLLSSLKPGLILTGGTLWVMLERQNLAHRLKLMKIPKILFRQKKAQERREGEETRQVLEESQQQLLHQLRHIEREDPKNRPERALENALEEESDEAYEGSRAEALRRAIFERLNGVRIALKKLRGGSYGICDSCGEKIDPARLKALPDATYCLKCEAEVEKKRAAQ